MGAGRVRARRGSGSVRVRNGRLLAQIRLVTEAVGATRTTPRTRSPTNGSPTTCGGGSPSRRRRGNLAAGRWLGPRWRTIGWSSNGTSRPGSTTARSERSPVRELDAFASRKLAAGYAPATVNRMRETLRSALSTAVRQDRLLRNVARYGGGVAADPPQVDRFTDHELALLLKAARDEHFFPILLLLARTGLRIGEACGLRWRDLHWPRSRRG